MKDSKGSDLAVKVLVVVLFLVIVGVAGYLFMEMNQAGGGVEAAIELQNPL